MSQQHSTPIGTVLQSCINKARELEQEQIESTSFTDEKNTSQSCIITDENSEDIPPAKIRRFDVSQLTASERLQLAFDLGSFEAKSLKSYALSSTHDKDLNSLLSIDVKTCHQSSVCETLRSFLSGLSHASTDQSESSRPSNHEAYQLCKSIESVLNLSALNLTLPAHFRESVLLYTLTGSKLALKI